MATPNDQFLVSTEIECLTAVPANPPMTAAAVSRFLQVLSEQAPSLPGPSGFFMGYGRVYSDVGHVELALPECDDPYLLPSLCERLQILCARPVEQLEDEGTKLVLANNNHSELLKDDCAVWGAHENYLVEQHPRTFTEQILAFMVTRLFQGAGGLHFPTGNFLAAVRPVCMHLATGGGTTESRAIHSTAREEHHMGLRPKRFRYHQILGDGHRSHYNLALQLAATALTIKAIFYDAELRSQLAELRGQFGPCWVTMLRKLNVLATPEQPLAIHPLVLTTQRIYLAAARRYADRISDPPAWIARALNDWQDTLDAYERLDRSWLAAHLDAFAKYELFTAVLHESGHTWKDLPAKKELFHELALLDQSYHEFCNPKSVFTRLESAGVLNHRVGPQVLPGQETDPFIPETSTRAQPRARFIREHQGCTEFMIDWSYVVDRKRQLRRQLDDPFAQQFGPWQKSPVDGPSGAPSEALNQVLSKFDQGRYDEADVQLRRFEACFEPLGRSLPTSAVRYRAWLQARRGFTDGPEVLARLYRRGPRSFLQTNDYCCVYRFRGLVPDLEQMEPWIRRGLEQLGNGHSETGDVFRDHVAYTLLRHGRMEQALEVLQPVLTRQSLARICPRMKGRIFSTAGEAWRRLGNRRRASRYLKEAKELQLQHRYFGLLAQFTYASLAKWERTRRMALQWLTKAAVIQTGNRHHLGHANSLLLQARLCRDTQQAESARSKILEYRAALPVLAECTLLGRILEHWDAWTAGENLTEEDDDFWGL